MTSTGTRGNCSSSHSSACFAGRIAFTNGRKRFREEVGFLRAVNYAYLPAGNDIRETHDTRGMVSSGRSGL